MDQKIIKRRTDSPLKNLKGNCISSNQHFQYQFNKLRTINTCFTWVLFNSKHQFLKYWEDLKENFIYHPVRLLLGQVTPSIDQLCYLIQWESNVYRSPNKLSLQRDQYHTNKNFFTFGGMYYQRSTHTNHKRINQSFSLNLIKMMLIYLKKCDIK